MFGLLFALRLVSRLAVLRVSKKKKQIDSERMVAKLLALQSMLPVECVKLTANTVCINRTKCCCLRQQIGQLST